MRCLAPAAAAALLMHTGAALAQTQELQLRAAAEQLFKDATDAMARRDYAAACPKLEEVTRLLPGKIGAMYRLASCYEESGKLTSAWAEYRLVAVSAPPSDELKAAADAKVAALEPRLPRLVVSVAPAARGTTGLAVTRDGLPVGPAQWGEPIPVDPGAHTISATAPQKKDWSASVSVVAGTPGSVEVPALADAAPLPIASVPPAAPPGVDQAPARKEGAPAWAWALGGVGLAAGITSAVFAGLGVAGQNAIYASCGLGKPDDQATCNSLGRANNVKQGLAWGFGGVGVIGVVAGVVGIATAPRKRAAMIVDVTPMVGASGGGVTIRRAF